LAPTDRCSCQATINAETSALLLASKSNYQNILEGTHLPGVSYPEALSTNLTSKRTSHKIAEQGRRNRINNALQEIASLLPSSTPQLNGVGGRAGSVDAGTNGTSGGGGDGSIMTGTAAQQSNSKASTVEMAIEYIKSLQTELKDVRGRLEDAENRLGEDVEKRLGERGSVVGSPTAVKA
jgi:subtilase family serine protease